MDPEIFYLFISLAMIGINIRQIRQICQILLISWNLGKPQLQRWPGRLGRRFEDEVSNGLQLLESTATAIRKSEVS